MQFLRLSNNQPEPPLYEQDFYVWTNHTATLLKERRFNELDLSSLVEEIETLGRSEKHAVQSNLIIVLLHLLKYKYQPERRTNSWLASIAEHRDRLDIILADSPSLKVFGGEAFANCYEKARRRAAIETELPIATFPVVSPFTPEEVLDANYLPE